MDFRKNRKIRLGPFQPGEFTGIAPPDLLVLKGFGLAFHDPALESRQADRDVTIRPFDHGFEPFAHRDKDSQLFPKLAPQRLLVALPRIHLSTGKFPKPSEMPAEAAAACKHPALGINDHSADDFDHCPVFEP